MICVYIYIHIEGESRETQTLAEGLRFGLAGLQLSSITGPKKVQPFSDRPKYISPESFKFSGWLPKTIHCFGARFGSKLL